MNNQPHIRFLNRRFLSQALIVTLLLLSPISFSTDKVPNFQPDCETHIPLSDKMQNSVAVIRTTAIQCAVTLEIQASPLFFPASVSPPANPFFFPTPSRAPPA